MRVIFLRSLPSLAILGLTLLQVSACTPQMANRGAVLEAEQVQKIVIGESSRENILNLLGSPTQVSTFDEKIWYYISRKTEQYSFLDPEIIAQKNIAIQFDEAGIVTTLNEFDASDAKTFAPVARRTPTYGKETTFIEQLIGNVGRPSGSTGR